MKRAEIEQLLPGVFRQTIQPLSPLAALLEVMETLQAPSEGALDRLETYFDPRRAPDHFVPYLAGWVDLDRVLTHESDQERRTLPSSFASGLGALRELIAAAAELSRWRGTRRGLTRFLEIATGVSGFEIDEAVAGDDGLPRPFHILVRVPAGARQHQGMIRQIVEMEKPAYVTHEIEFA